MHKYLRSRCSHRFIETIFQIIMLVPQSLCVPLPLAEERSLDVTKNASSEIGPAQLSRPGRIAKAETVIDESLRFVLSRRRTVLLRLPSDCLLEVMGCFHTSPDNLLPMTEWHHSSGEKCI